MSSIKNKSSIFFAILLIAWLTFFSPAWLSLFGVTPCWSVIFLLPWALKKGELSGIMAGLFVGLLLDGMSYMPATNIPVLCFLGFWWGKIGKKGPPIKQSFILGLLAFLGAIFFGLSLWLQTIFLDSSDSLFFYWGLQTILSQSIITGLFAPIICSWVLLFMNPRNIYN